VGVPAEVHGGEESSADLVHAWGAIWCDGVCRSICMEGLGPLESVEGPPQGGELCPVYSVSGSLAGGVNGDRLISLHIRRVGCEAGLGADDEGIITKEHGLSSDGV
jgi:hypothetical protein